MRSRSPLILGAGRLSSPAGLLANSSAVYGAMTTVVAFISVLFLASNAIVFCYEASVVWAWRLWPRGVDINNLFPADERAYALLSLMDERMPSQRNGIYFDAHGHDDDRRTGPGGVDAPARRVCRDHRTTCRRTIPRGNRSRRSGAPEAGRHPNSETARRSQGDQSWSGLVSSRRSKAP